MSKYAMIRDNNARARITVLATAISMLLPSGVSLGDTTAAFVRGNPQAPWVIHAYMDYMCAYCAHSFITLHLLHQAHPNKVGLRYNVYPNPASEASVRLTKLAYCSHQSSPGNSWQLSAALYSLPLGVKDNLRLTPGTLRGLGVASVAAVSECMEDVSLDEVANLPRIKALNFTGTPGFEVKASGADNTIRLQGHRSLSQWRDILNLSP